MTDDDLTVDDLTGSDEESEKPNFLRDKAEKAIKQRDQAREDAKKARTELALIKSGLDTLPAERQEALLTVHKGDITPDGLQQTAVQMGWAQAPAPPEPTQEQQVVAAQQEMSSATQDATSTSSVLTLSEITSWGVNRQADWMREHPEEWEALKRSDGGMTYKARAVSSTN